MENYPWRRINHKLLNCTKVWKGNGDTSTFSLKGLEILHQEWRWQVKSIFLQKPGPANKKNTYQSMLIIHSVGLQSVNHFQKIYFTSLVYLVAVDYRLWNLYIPWYIRVYEIFAITWSWIFSIIIKMKARNSIILNI